MALNTREKIELFQLRLKTKIDSRMTACRVEVSAAAGGVINISGFTHYPQTDAFVKMVAAEVFPGSDLKFSLKILERGKPKFAVASSAVAKIWRNPDDSNPETLDSEAIYGTVVRVYHTEGKFKFVQHPDGYVGYASAENLKSVSIDEYLDWKNGEHGITLRAIQAGDILMPPGTRLRRVDGQFQQVDGSLVKIAKKDIAVFDPSRSNYIKNVEERAEEFMPSPYLWGGKSEVGIDCSGFTQTLALQEGIVLPRDASMQCHVGEIVGYLPDYADLLPGDIIFFMNKNAFVFHVGIYLGNHTYMHSAGKTGPIKSSVYKNGENYVARYDNCYVYARRVHR